MSKEIYKITNLINNKIYIGQSNNARRRFREHIQHNTNTGIHNAIVKYGKENFSFEILEKCENYNEREKYWINYFQSNNPDKGYNLTEGGDEPPRNDYEKHWNCKITLERAREIQKALLSGEYNTLREIAKTFNVTIDIINHINVGHTWNKEGLEYPLFDPLKKQKDDAQQCKILLKNTNMSHKNIGKKFNRSRTWVTSINQGINFHDENENYPIRPKNKRCYN